VFFSKGLFLVPLLSLHTVSAASINLDETLYIVTHHLPPFSACKNKEVKKSFIKDLVDTACAEANLACIVECFPNRRAKAMLEMGAAHGAYPLGRDSTREKWLIWSPELNATEYGFYRKKGSNYSTINDFIGKTVGVFEPSNALKSLVEHQDVLRQKNGNTFTISIQPSSTGLNIRKLAMGRLDAVYINKAVGDIQIKALNIKEVEYAFPVKKLNYYIGYSNEKNQGKRKELIDKFNRAISYIKQNGDLKKIVEEHNMDQPIETIN
jgi:polar amino acid transport system substrate-binding protein